MKTGYLIPALLLLLLLYAAGCMGPEEGITREQAAAIALNAPEVREQIAGQQYLVTGVWDGTYEGREIYDVHITVITADGRTTKIRYLVAKDGTPVGPFAPKSPLL